MTVAGDRLQREEPTSVGVPSRPRGCRSSTASRLPQPRPDVGYYGGRGDRRRTAEGIRTGDLGRIDERGRVFLTGRLKDLIIGGGLNIAPAEIEAVACEHPGVQAVVVGIPDERWGETPVVVAIPARGNGLAADDVLQHCRRELTSFKRLPPPRWSTCCRPPASASPRRPSSGGRSSTGRSSLSAPTDVATLLARHGEGRLGRARARDHAGREQPAVAGRAPAGRAARPRRRDHRPPGAGKSTLTGRLIEAYANAGARVGVLAIDPSSPISGGAVLGDRLRMETHLLGRDDVFVRSLASRGSHGRSPARPATSPACSSSPAPST